MEMQAGGAATPPAMPPAGTTPALTMATTPAVALATAAPQLVWMSQSDWLKVVTRSELKAELKVERPKKMTVAAQVGRAHRMPAEWKSSNVNGVCVNRLHNDERAAAAGFDGVYRGSAVRRVERRQEDPERAALEREAEARRKRARRVELEKEDRDALRELASTHNAVHEALPLEATPAGLRETAVDGTPRSAKAAGAQLRALTQSFYQRLTDPRFYGFEHEDLLSVQVRTESWQPRQFWESGVRNLKRFGGIKLVFNR